MAENSAPQHASWLAAAEFGAAGRGAHALQAEILPAYLQKRRWYASKDKGRPAVRIARVVPIPTGATHDVLLTVLDVEPPDSPREHYMLALAFADRAPNDPHEAYILATASIAGRAGFVVDAAVDDAFVRTVLGRMVEPPIGAKGGALAAHRTGALAGIADGLLDAPVKRTGAEQSNTSMVLGDAAVLKLIRKLQVGVHPEPEIGVFLTEVARFPNTPALLGYMELQAPEGPVLVSTLQRFVPNEGDGWGVILGRLRERLGEVDREPLVDSRSLQIARQLGKRTAQMHHALATPTEDPAFKAERIDEAVLEEWVASVEAMANRALEGLTRARFSLPEDARGAAEKLLGLADLPERIRALQVSTGELVRTRIHGDYHLGQVLIARDDVYIVDFEGEPMRPLGERRSKHSPLRDVAGMLRSIAYAAAAVSREAPAPAAPDVTRQWTEGMSRGFLDAYREAIAGCSSYPSNPADADQLLTLFLLDKAFYEVTYELANRPDWVAIPLRGLVEILDRPGSRD